MFFCFLVDKNIFLGLFFGTHLDNLLPFCAKNQKLHTKSPKKKQKVSQKKLFFPEACFSGSVERCSVNPDKNFDQMF